MDFAESLSSVISESTNLCMSGGADGADLQWGMNAGKLGHHVIHWSFRGHRSQAPEQEVVQLTQDQLNAADDAIRRANKRVNRSFPSKSDTTNNLLRRNWYQVRDTQSVYAVSELTMGKHGPYVSGGTAWAVQMYLDRFIYDGEDWNTCNCWLYDKNTKRWYRWETDHWEIQISRPLTPKGLWTGIGSRDIDVWTRIEIRKVMGTYEMTDQLLAAIHPIVEDPKPGDIIYVPAQKIPGKGRLDRTGGFAVVRRIHNGLVSMENMTNDDEVVWDEIKHLQVNLRSEFKLNPAQSKPDFTTENNTLLYWK